MILISNNMFSQFIPSSFFSIPLMLMGTLIAISWKLWNSQSHWLPSRSDLTKSSMELMFKKLLGDLKIKKKKWSNWLLSTFLLCLTYKLLSLIPYTFSQTSHFSMTFSLSLPMWCTFQMAGLIHKWKSKMSHLLPQGTPMFLVPLMIMMETMSLFIQPLTLGFRLGANLLAGHLLMFLCSCVVWSTMSTNPLTFLTFILLLLLFMLEMAVACMQAAVFLILSKQYLEENMK